MMESWEQLSLRAFREIARKVRGNSIVTDGLTIKSGLLQHEGARMELAVQLLPEEAFKALAVDVRNVYAQEGAGNVYKVQNVIGRYDEGEYRERAIQVRGDYQKILRGDNVEFHVHGQRIHHEELFKAWLNRYTFHQDAFKDPTIGPYEMLKSTLGPAVDAVVQKVALQIGGCILELDDVIADWRQEERLPRIAPTSSHA